MLVLHHSNSDELCRLASDGPYVSALQDHTRTASQAFSACDETLDASSLATTAESQAPETSADGSDRSGTPFENGEPGPLRGENDTVGDSSGGASAARVIGMHTPAHAVCRFLNATLCFLLPPSLHGGPRNSRTLSAHIARFVRLRRFERFTLHEAMQGLSTRCFPPPSKDLVGEEMRINHSSGGPTQLSWRQKMLGYLVDWVLSCLVVPLIRTAFYATECEGFRNRVFYYRKPLWAKVRTAALRQLNRDAMFRPLSDKQAASVLEGRPFGSASLRLLPKAKRGVRLILNLSRRTRHRRQRSSMPPQQKQLSEPHIARSAHEAGTADAAASAVASSAGRSKRVHYGRPAPRSINDALTDAFLVLKYEKASRPEISGATVTGLQDIFRRLLPFVAAHRRGLDVVSVSQERLGQLRPLHIVTTDIKHCYDSIPHNVLCDVVLPRVLRCVTIRTCYYLVTT
eukprot:SAG31_NODE_201_length_20535_cov_15.315081_15_plen_458_part_00